MAIRANGDVQELKQKVKHIKHDIKISKSGTAASIAGTFLRTDSHSATQQKVHASFRSLEQDIAGMDADVMPEILAGPGRKPKRKKPEFQDKSKRPHTTKKVEFGELKELKRLEEEEEKRGDIKEKKRQEIKEKAKSATRRKVAGTKRKDTTTEEIAQLRADAAQIGVGVVRTGKRKSEEPVELEEVELGEDVDPAQIEHTTASDWRKIIKKLDHQMWSKTQEIGKLDRAAKGKELVVKRSTFKAMEKDFNEMYGNRFVQPEEATNVKNLVFAHLNKTFGLKPDPHWKPKDFHRMDEADMEHVSAFVVKLQTARNEISKLTFSALDLRHMLKAIGYPTEKFDKQLRGASPKSEELHREVTALRLKRDQAQHALKVKTKVKRKKGIHSAVQRSKARGKGKKRRARTPSPPRGGRGGRGAPDLPRIEEEDEKRGSPPPKRRARRRVDVASGDGPYRSKSAQRTGRR